MLFGKLQGFNHAQHFIDITAQRQVVNHLVADNAFLVNQERAAEGYCTIGRFNIVCLAHRVGQVGCQGVFYRADAAFVDRGIAPGIVSEVRIDGTADDLNTAFGKLFQAVIKSDQLGRTDKGKVQRIEKQHRVFTLDGILKVIVVNDLAVAQDCRSRKIRRFATYKYTHGNFLNDIVSIRTGRYERLLTMFQKRLKLQTRYDKAICQKFNPTFYNKSEKKWIHLTKWPSAPKTTQRMLLTSDFFRRDTCLVARELPGKIIRRKVGRQWLAARIIETEAYYTGEKGSHASLGFTEKRRALFMPPGTIYMYYARGGDSFNISTRGKGNAVLIKAAFPHEDALTDPQALAIMQRLNPDASSRPRPPEKLCRGQTLLCRALAIKVTEWDAKPFDKARFYLDDIGARPERIIRTTRLGIPPGRDEHLHYRFIDYDYARDCSSNPLTKRGWREGREYSIITASQAGQEK